MQPLHELVLDEVLTDVLVGPEDGREVDAGVGEGVEAVPELVRLLREEARVID